MTDELDHGPAPLFQASYSPKLIRFWLLHWPVLSSLAERAPGARELEAKHLREWQLLADRPHFSCLCQQMNTDPPPAPTYRGSNGYAPAGHTASQIRADLEGAANALPVWWRATAMIFVYQERLIEWRARLARWTAAEGSSMQSDPEPEKGSLFIVVERMARSLGWRPDTRLTGRDEEQYLDFRARKRL